MNVAFSSQQLDWLKSEVDAGRFESIDEAIAVAVADLKAISSRDLDWTKPFVESARDSVRQGKVVSADEFSQRIAKKLDGLQSS